MENGRRRATRALIAVSFSLTVSFATLIPGASQADPQPTPLTIDQVSAQADALANDAEIATARERLGAAAIIGVSCYDSLERARQFAAAGADYLAFGAFFASPTKPQARPATTQFLRAATALGKPRLAIGAITPANAHTPSARAGRPGVRSWTRASTRGQVVTSRTPAGVYCQTS